MNDDRILGFDAREAWMQPPASLGDAGNWGTERKENWLLRSDVARPLSTDCMVWPSVFDVDDRLIRPEWVGLVQDMWNSLAALGECLDEQWKSGWKPCRIIAVTLDMRTCTDGEMQQWQDVLDPTSPSELDQTWEFLGYDVADRWLLSGLSNCTDSGESDFVALRARFGPKLNPNHLLSKKEDALEFKSVSNDRVPDHAPFYLYKLWLIAENRERFLDQIAIRPNQ